VKQIFRRLRAAGSSVSGLADLNRQLVARTRGRRFPERRQLKYFFSVLTPYERATVRWSSGILVVCLLVLGARTWVDHVIPVPAHGGEYVEAVVGTPSLPNPLYAIRSDVDADLTRLMYAGIMTFTGEGQLVPDLAESYEVSGDGTEYIFRLKDGLTWHDGESLTVDDVLFTLNVLQDANYKSPLTGVFRGVKAERVDDRTVRFALEKASASFLTTLTTGILPAHIWRDVAPTGAQLAEYNLKPIGAGPYRFKSLVRDRLGTIRSYTMERFANAATPALLDRITFQFFVDSDTASASVAAKQTDGMAFAPLEMRPRLDQRRDVESYTIRLPQITAIFFNQQKQPLFAEEAVRHALVAATPREQILRDIVHGNGVLAEGPLVPGMIGYDSTLVQAATDASSSAKMLEKAGFVFPTPTSTVRVRSKTKSITIGTGRKATTKTVADGKPVPLSVSLTTVDRPEYKAVAETVATAWRAVGFEVNVITVAGASIGQEVLRSHEYQALLYGEVLGGDQDPYSFWHSSQSAEGKLNLALYVNRSVDDLLTAARSATSTEALAPLYASFAKKVVEDAPAIFLYAPAYPYYIANKIHGVALGLVATPADRLAGIRDWYTKTRLAWR
jgi:peptide/nickel transport system substrate-binding protein